MFKLRPDLLRKEQIPLGKEECLAGSEKLGILSASAKSVIPESADGGYPESRKNNTLLDTGSRLRLVRYDDWGRFPDFFSSLLECLKL
jgi:hypothetical protein